MQSESLGFRTLQWFSVFVISCLIQISFLPLARAAGPNDRQEVEAFIDAQLTELMEEYHIPGAVFGLVKDGEIYFTKGYGFADLESRKPVIPDQTLFRVASISKLFVATSLMQLYEKGLIDLDDDVNKHLTLFKIDDTFPEPVTVANLLTHTAGFDERMIGKENANESDVIPLGPYLAEYMPPRYAPPWDQYCYSNHGYSLAGYLVEIVSGSSFAQYVDENIFQPLGMERSSFVRPPSLAPDIAVGYSFEDGVYRRLPYHYLNDAPAGELNATATDMGRFMIAHLQHGEYLGARILKEETARQMHKWQFGHHPRLPGAGYGFFEILENNQRMVGHIGGLDGFGSLMFLLPEHNVGIFLAYNSSGVMGKPDIIPTFGSRFLDHYYPTNEKFSEIQPLKDSGENMDRFIGNYLINRYSRRTIEKIQTFFAQFRVEQAGNGALTIHYPLNFKESSKWVQVEPLVFQRTDANGYVAFAEDEDGAITNMFIDAIPVQYTTKLRWYQENTFQLMILAICALLFLSACIIWPLANLLFKIRVPSDAEIKGKGMPRLLAGSASMFNLAFLVGFVLVLPKVLGALNCGVPPILVGLLCVPLLSAVLAVGSVPFAALAWKEKYWSVIGRAHYTLVVLALLVFIIFLNHWNLLGFKF